MDTYSRMFADVCSLAILLIGIRDRICFNVCFIQQDTIFFTLTITYHNNLHSVLKTKVNTHKTCTNLLNDAIFMVY